MKYCFFFLFALTFSACGECEKVAELTLLKEELAITKTQLANNSNISEYVPGLVHSVFFWLKEDLSEADEKAFLAGVNSLRTVESVRKCYIGPPAATEARGVVDNTYNYALLVHFDDIKGQDAYQIAPIHLKFVEEHQDKWTKVIVYDNVVSN